MPLTINSNKINAVGIFGRLQKEQEKHFQEIEKKFSNVPKGQKKDFFNHLSVIINKNVSTGRLFEYINLLKELKQYLPLKLEVLDVIIIDGQHLALSFNTKQTEKIRETVKDNLTDGIIETFYTKVVWFVPKNKQKEAIEALKQISELVFDDFVLCVNKQNDNFVIYTSNSYK